MDRQLTITLSDEDARFIDEQVQAGVYASADDLVNAGIQRLMRRAEQKQREFEELKRSIEEAIADPRPAVTSEELMENLRRRNPDLFNLPRRA